MAFRLKDKWVLITGASSDTPLNYKIQDDMSEFKVAQHKKIEHPNADQIAANKVKWGWT